MSSPTFDSLRETLKNLRRRRSRLFFLKQSGYFLISLSLIVLVFSGLSAWLELNKTATTGLFAALIASLAVLLWQTSRQLGRRHTDDRHLAHYVEDHIPDLEQRLLTSLEFSEEDLVHGKKGVSQQFIRQLWQDAQEHVQLQQENVETVTPARASWVSLSSAAAVMAVVAIIFISSEAIYTAGSRLIWPFAISEPVTVVEILDRKSVV